MKHRISLSLSDEAIAWIEDQVKSLKSDSKSHVVEKLIAKERKKAMKSEKNP